MLIAFLLWHLHFDGSPRRLHIVCVVTVFVDKFFAVVHRVVNVPPPHLSNSVVRCPTVGNDCSVGTDEPAYSQIF